MASSDVIKEFLVALGWKNDEVAQKKIFDSVDKLGKNLLAISVAAEAAALAITASLAKAAQGFESLYYTSSRSGSSIKELNAFKFAASQMGSSAEEAQGAVEGLAKKLRENPGYSSWLKSLGATDPKNVVKSLNEIAPKLAQMPLYVAESISKQFDIPENLLLALRQVGEFRKFEEQANKKYGILGFDPQKAAEDGRKLSMAFRDLYDTFAKIGEETASGLFKDLQPQIKSLNDFLLAHGKEISDDLVKIGDAVFKAFDWMVRHIPDVDHFAESMGGWNKALAALGAVVSVALIARLGGLLGSLRGLTMLVPPGWLLLLLGLSQAGGDAGDGKSLKPTFPSAGGSEAPDGGTYGTDKGVGGFIRRHAPSWVPDVLTGRGKHAKGREGFMRHVAEQANLTPGVYRPQYRLGDADLSDAVINKVAGEARAYNREGVDAVLNNMFNRLGTHTYGPSGDLRQVATAPGQYTGFRVPPAKEADFIRSRIRAIASGGVPDNTNGSNEYRADWYHGPWGWKHPEGVNVGGNVFAYNQRGGRGPWGPYTRPHRLPQLPALPRGSNPFGGFDPDALRRSMSPSVPLGAGVGNAKNVSIIQTNHNTVTGVSDPTQAAAQIGARHNKHSSMLLRNVQSAVA